jgi:hypothetical protein
MHVDRDTATVVTHGNRSIYVHIDFDLRAKSGEMFVDRVVENLENHVVQTALIGVADVHARALADGFEPFEFIDLRRVVFLGFLDSDGVVSAIFIALFVVFGLGQSSGSHQVSQKIARTGVPATTNLGRVANGSTPRS